MYLKIKDKIYRFRTKMQMVLIVVRMDDHETTANLLSQLETVRIKNALRASGGVQKNAAKLVSLSPPALSRKITNYGIDTSEYHQPRPNL